MSTDTVTEHDTFERLRKAKEQIGQVPTDEDGNVVDPLEHLRAKLNLPTLKRIIRRGSGADAEFDFELDDGTVIPVGKSADLLNPRKVEAALHGTANVVLAYHGPKQFRQLARLFPAITVVVETGGGKAVEAKHWLATFCQRFPRRGAPIDLDDRAGELFDVIEPTRGDHAAPFRGSDGRLYVNAPSLTKHVKRHLDVPITEHEVRMRLTRLLGFEPAAGTGQLQARRGDRIVKLRALASPPGFDPEA